jgi:Flp pilus assembly secretin CpaC
VTKSLFVLAATLTLAIGALAVAQEKQEKPAPSQAPAKPQATVPLKVQIVLTRYQGEKKVSALPYTLSVNATSPTDRSSPSSLRMGAQIPVATTVTQQEAKPPVSSFQYKDVGTNIDCTATTLEDGRFRLTLLIEDTSVYGDEQAAAAVLDVRRAGTHPAFRSFRAAETLILRDGQSLQFTTGTDRINGEVVKVDVTLNLIK